MARWAWRALAALAGIAFGLATLWSGGLDAPLVHRLLHGSLATRQQGGHQAADHSRALSPSSLTVQRVGAPPKRLPGADVSISTQASKLQLMGTVLGRNIHEGYAMLGVSPDNPQTYAAGALLLNGARLAEIHEKYVVLERDGRSARLYLKSSGESAGTSGRDNPLLFVGGQQAPSPATSVSHEPLTDYLRPNPVYDSDVISGYQMYPGKNTAVFARLGLQPGDVVTSVNGASFSNSDAGFEIFRPLLDGAALAAVVLRKGKPENIVLDGSAIIAEREASNDAVSMRAALPDHPPTALN